MEFHNHDMQTESSSCSCLGTRNRTKMVLHCVSGDNLRLVICTLASCLAKGVAENRLVLSQLKTVLELEVFSEDIPRSVL